MKKLFLFLLFSAFLAAQTNPNYNLFVSQPEVIFENRDSEAFYTSGEAENEFIMTNNAQANILANPDYKWLHPSPIGTSMGNIKVWDANTVYAFGSGGTFVKTTDGGQTFSLNPFAGVPLGSPVNTTYDIYGSYFFDMNTFYLCGALGVTKTTDGGQTFNAVGTGSITSGTARRIHFLNPDVGYIVGTSTIRLMKTTDAGDSWTMNTNLPSTTYFGLQVFDENKIIVGGSTSSSANIRTTTDGGATWNAIAAGNGTIYSFAFMDSLLGFAGSSSGRGYRTTDGGFTWNQVLTAPTTSTFYEVFIKGTDVYFAEDDSLLFITPDSGATFTTQRYLPLGKPNQIMRSAGFSGTNLFVVGDNGYFIKSTDNGSNWNTQSTVLVSGFVQGIWGDQTGKVIAVGTNSPNQVVVSNDYGATFTSVALSVSNADLRAIYMHDATSGYAVGSGGRIWKTTDGGNNWELYDAATIQAFSSVDFIDNLNGIVSGNGGQIWKTNDGGANWLSISNTGLTIGFNGCALIDTNTALVTGSNLVFKTTNGGTSWSQITPGVPIGPTSRIRMINDTTGYLIGGSGTSQQGYIFRTMDAGDTWINTNFPYTGSMIYDIAFRSDSDYVVVGIGGNVFHTKNGGSSWEQYNLGLLNVVQSQVIGLTFVHQDTIIVGGAGASLVKVAVEPIIPVELVSFTASITNNSIRLFWTTATELNNRGFQIERKLSNSDEWNILGFIQGAGTSTESRTYVYDDFNINTGSYNYRIRQFDFDGTASVYNLPETVEFGAPVNFELSQNYPNPFNPSTTISFSIPNKDYVTLKVYDIIGNEVVTLVNEEKAPGNYQITFDASEFSSGVYFYSILAGNFSEVKKMMLIK